MRHNKNFNHLGRQAAHRNAMLANMAVSLIKHKKINTTLAKAKELRKFVEPLITKSKEDTTHSRRVVFQELQNKEAVTILFGEISSRIADRPGGYTRILKTGFRLGDAAQMCFIELVDYNENMLKAKSEKKASKTRRGGKKAAAKAVEAAAEEAPKAEAPKADAAEEKAAQLNGVALEIAAKVSVTGQLYGSVGAAQVADELVKLGKDVDRKIITMKDAKKIGDYVALVHFHKEVTVEIPVKVVAENAAELKAAADAEAAIKAAADAKAAAAVATEEVDEEAEVAEEETPAEA